MAKKENIQQAIDELDVGSLAITEAEVRGMLEAAGLADMAADSTAVKYFTGQINAAMIQAQPALYNTLAAELTGTASKATLEATKLTAQRQARRWAKEFSSTEMNKIGDVIKVGLKEGWNPLKTAQFLDQVKGLDSGRAATLRKFIDALDAQDPPLSPAKYKRMLDKEKARLLLDRKRTIARTEQANAQETGARIDALANGSEWKSWLTAGDGRVSDACQGNESEGWIPINDTFEGGVQAPTQHPRCRCSLAYRKDSPSKGARDRASARSARTTAAKAAEQTKE